MVSSIPEAFSFQEGLLVADYILVSDRGKNSDLVEGVLGFLIWKVS